MYTYHVCVCLQCDCATTLVWVCGLVGHHAISFEVRLHTEFASLQPVCLCSAQVTMAPAESTPKCCSNYKLTFEFGNCGRRVYFHRPKPDQSAGAYCLPNLYILEEGKKKRGTHLHVYSGCAHTRSIANRGLTLCMHWGACWSVSFSNDARRSRICFRPQERLRASV